MTILRKAARGQPCMVRLPGCDGGGETTVLAHYRMAGYCGTGMKPPDELGAWCCDRCHALCRWASPRTWRDETGRTLGACRGRFANDDGEDEVKFLELISEICRRGAVFLLIVASLIAMNAGKHTEGVILACAGILGLIGLDILSELKARK